MSESDNPLVLRLNEKHLAVLAYSLGFVTGCLLYRYSEERHFLRYHATQCIVVFGCVFLFLVVANGLALVLSVVPILGTVVGLVVTSVTWLLVTVCLILWLFLMYNAYRGEWYEVPLAGEFAHHHTAGRVTLLHKGGFPLLRLPTAVFLLHPKLFLENPGREFDLRQFSNEQYEWERDPLWGLWDIAQCPQETIESGTGDCVDYSRLVASTLYYQTDRPITLYALRQDSVPFRGHLVVYDGRYVYTSGSIRAMDINEYVRESDYSFNISRTIR